MYCVDLISCLNRYGNDGKSNLFKLQRVTAYGIVVSELNRPSNLKSSVDLDSRGKFVKMHLFAVDLSEYEGLLKQSGYKSKDNLYLVNGEIALYVDERTKLNEWYSVTGSIRRGTQSAFPYLDMLFYYKKQGKVNWSVGKNTLDTISLDYWTSNYYDNFNPVYNSFVESWNNKKIILPKEVSALPRFYAEPNTVVQVDNSALKQVQSTPAYMLSDTKKINFTPETRDSIKDRSAIVEDLQGILDVALERKQEYLASLLRDFKMDLEVTSYIVNMVNALENHWRTKPSIRGNTGRDLLKQYLGQFDNIAKEPYLSSTAGDYLMSSFSQVADFIRSNHNTSLQFSGTAYNLVKTAFSNSEAFYAKMIAIIIGVSIEAMDVVSTICIELGVSFSKVINANPYILQLFEVFSYNDIQMIATAFGKVTDASLDEFRNVVLINSYINSTDTSDTIYSLKSLASKNIGITLTERQYQRCRATGTYISETVASNAKVYLLNGKPVENIPLSMFRQIGRKYVQNMSATDIDKAVSDYVETGLGIKYQDYITSSSMLEKELFVYNYLYESGKTPSGLKHEDIDKCIDEYEEKVGFKFEPEQRKAVHLIYWKSGAISGGAGSGKTTTSDCFVYTISKLVPKSEFHFAAPTGKAAKKLQEVVKKPCKTMHSLFKVGDFSANVFSKDEDDCIANDCYYLLDENAMVTLDLLYACLKKTSGSTDSCFYFFGDYQQLPPIGKGLPFKNLLRFLPSVFLRVSKRAAEGSNITYNAMLINEASDYNNWKPLVSGKDFCLLPCNETSLSQYTIEICKLFLGLSSHAEREELRVLLQKNNCELPTDLSDITPDDIQVVTPLSKATYSWGTTQLNAKLQPLFNKNTGYRKTFVSKLFSESPETRFIVGDRVVNLKNRNTMQWYASFDESGIVEKRYGYGISNGDVGKIVGFIPSDSLTIEDEVDSIPYDGFEYPQSLRDDSTWHADDKWFVVVKFYDFISDSDFYLLYRCTENYNVTSNVGRNLIGEDLTSLNLFYAGTVHKLQGSQAKVIISPLGSVNYNGFITRNMVYTDFTRAQKYVYALGSVDNSMNSQLSRARKEIAEAGVLTVGELLYP